MASSYSGEIIGHTLMRERRARSISSTIAVLLMILIAVAASIIVYLWLGGFTGSLQQAPGGQVLGEMLKIEGVRIVNTDRGILVILYVRNIGDSEVKVTAAYYGVLGSYRQASLAYTSSSPPIWGGDEWTFNRDTHAVERIEEGLIFYEDFRDGYDSSVWGVEINTLEEPGESAARSIDPQLGLVLTLDVPSHTNDIDKYGIRTTNRLSIPNGKYVFEIAMGKLSGVDYNYLAETYISPGDISGNQDPYGGLYYYLMVEMRGSGVNSDIAIVKRRGNDKKPETVWSGGYNGITDVTYVEWLMVFPGTGGNVDVYYNETYATYVWGLSRGVYEYPYIYLDIGIWRGERGVLSVYFPWVKVYRDLAFTIDGLSEGWRVLLVDDSGNVLGDKMVPAGETSVSFHRLDDDLTYPLDAHIVVIPTMGDASEVGYVIEPGETKAVAVFIEEELPGSFSIKVVTESGVEAVFNVRR